MLFSLYLCENHRHRTDQCGSYAICDEIDFAIVEARK